MIEGLSQLVDVEPGPAHAVGISPQAKVLPANVLRFFVHFSSTAEGAFSRRDLRLRTAAGNVVGEPFLVLSEELWSPDGRRLTVLMEPGRIKRGMGGGAAHQPALVVGKRYVLEVRTGGVLLAKAFSVTTPVLEPLDERRWNLTRPRLRTRHKLVVVFDRTIDEASALDEVAMIGPDELPIEGRFDLSKDGQKLFFWPSDRWQPGRHRLDFSRRFEDVCGNRLGEALDHPIESAQRARRGSVWFEALP